MNGSGSLLRAFSRRLFAFGQSGTAIAHVATLRSVTLALNVCTGLITAAFLGPQGRGEQAAIMLAPQALAGLATFGLHASLIYNVKADPKHEREYITIDLLLTFSAGIVAIAAAWFLMPHWLEKYSATTIAQAREFLLVTPLITASHTFMAVLESRSRFGTATQTGCLQSTCTLIILCALVLSGNLTPATAAAAYACSAALAFIYLGFVSGYRIDAGLALPLPLFGRLIHYGLRSYGVDVIGVASAYLDQIVIAAMLSPSALGVYVVALSVSGLMNVLPSSAVTVLFPMLAAKPTNTIVETIAAAVRILTLINAAAALCLAVLAPHVLALLYGAKFSAAVPPLLILLVAAVPTGAVDLLYQSYAGSGRPGVVTIIHGIGLAAAFCAMLLLVPTYGTVGAAFALLIAAIARLAFVLGGMPLILGVRVPRLIFSRSDLAWMRGR
jgi:O-antigen/teichoic acid export membrane protein